MVWERDYSHLMYKRDDARRNYFGYKGHEFQLGAIYQTLFVVRQDDFSYLVASIEVGKLKSKYFLDILNPTQNELVLFELEYGFEFPFCGCAVGIEDSPSVKRTTQEKNKKVS